MPKLRLKRSPSPLRAHVLHDPLIYRHTLLIVLPSVCYQALRSRYSTEITSCTNKHMGTPDHRSNKFSRSDASQASQTFDIDRITNCYFRVDDFDDGQATVLVVVNDEGKEQVIRPKPIHVGPPALLPVSKERHAFENFIVQDFANWPKLEWMVDGLFHVGSLVMVWGASGAGKTAWLLDLITCIAMGCDWAGRSVQSNHVLFCAMEGAQGFRDRVQAITDHYQFNAGWAIRTVFESVDLTDVRYVHGLAHLANMYSIKLIVIDTLAAALAGKVDENSNQQMAGIIDNAKLLTQLTGATVLLTHHTGHDTRNERGATALRGGVDTSISINRRNRQRYWRVVKQRDGNEGFGGYFDLVAHSYSRPDGEKVDSVIAQQTESFTTEDAPGGRKQNNRNQPKAAATPSTPSQPSEKTLAVTKCRETVLNGFRVLWRNEVSLMSSADIESYQLARKDCIEKIQSQVSGDKKSNRVRSVENALAYLVRQGFLLEGSDGSLALPKSVR